MEVQSIVLPNVLLSEFFGAEGKYVAWLSDAFPKSRIIPRGHKVQLRGDASSLLRIRSVLGEMMAYYQAHGTVDEACVRACLKEETKDKNEGQQKGIFLLYNTKGEKITSKTAAQHALVDAVKNKDLVFAIGASGTGKTFLSVALALYFLKKERIRRIVLTRPMVEAGERLGFLPGDLKEKMNPYLRPMYDALYFLLSEQKVQYFLQENVIEIAPLAYMRGRTLNDAFIILDEAQNATATQLKMLLTRMGTRTKMVLTGDDSQVDLIGEKEPSALKEAISLLEEMEQVGVVRFEAKDTLRHSLVQEIITAYKKAKKNATLPQKQ